MQHLLERQYRFEPEKPRCSANPWAEFLPTWPCFWGLSYMEKFVCGFERYPTHPCVVYSFGSNLHFEFERAVHDLNPNCEIHIFDPTVVSTEGTESALKDRRWTFHPLGLGSQQMNVPRVGAVDSLTNIAKRLGHKHLDILKIDVEGSEFSSVKGWTSSNIPSIGQIQMEVHDQPSKREELVALMQRLDQLDFKHVHLELNGCKCAEITMVQRTFVPGFRNYSMAKDAPFHHSLEMEGPGPSFATMLRMTELSARERPAHHDLAAQLMAASANYPCRWTEEFAGGRPVCGLRELARHRPGCEALVMNSVYSGPDFRRGLLELVPRCKVRVVQVRRPPLTRPDSRCGLYLSPDFSGPAQCPLHGPCCATDGSWCGSTPSHCSGTDFRTALKENPLYSPTAEYDGPVEWVSVGQPPSQRLLDVVQVSGPSINVILEWLKSGGRAGQLILELPPSSSVTSLVLPLEAMGYRTFRKAVLQATPGLGLAARLELAMVYKDFNPVQAVP